ncbi:conserved hypothetical protein [Gammaproteobacteria bacterium]
MKEAEQIGVDDFAGTPRRSLWQLWLMVVIFALPVVASWFFYFNPQWLPATRSNHGELISPAHPWPQGLKLVHSNNGTSFMGPEVLGRHWTLLTVEQLPCAEACRAKLSQMLQIRRALGESQFEVERMVLLVGPLGTEDAAFNFEGARGVVADTSALPVLREFFGPNTDFWNHLYIMDPAGNLMMRYPVDAPSKDVLKDLEHLLRSSKH